MNSFENGLVFQVDVLPGAEKGRIMEQDEDLEGRDFGLRSELELGKIFFICRNSRV